MSGGFRVRPLFGMISLFVSDLGAAQFNIT